MKKQKEIIAFLVIINIGLAFFIPAVSADGAVYTEASVNPEVINLGESTTVTLRAVTNVTTEKRDADIVLVTDRSWSMRQSGWELVKEDEPAYTFSDVNVPRDDWSEIKTFTVDSGVNNLAAQITWDRVPGHEGSEASELVINLQRPDGTWIFNGGTTLPTDLEAGPGGKVDPPDLVGRSTEYYSGICTKPQTSLVENPEAGTWNVAVYGWNLRPKTNPPASIDVDISVYMDHAANPNDDLGKTDTVLSIDAAKNSAKSFIATMNENDRASYVKFGSYPVLAQGLTYMTSTGKTSMNATIDDTGLQGGTEINEGIDIAMNELVSNGREDVLKVIVLLTDGQNDYGTTPVLQSAHDAKDANITIITIGLTAFVNEEMLKEVATKLDYCYYAPNGAQLQGIYNEISEKIEDLTGARAYHVLPADVTYMGNASVEPDVNGQTLEWGISNLTPLEPWVVTFDVQPNITGNVSVNVVPDSSVNYTTDSPSGTRKVTGGGCQIPTPGNPKKKATFGFVAQYKVGEIEPSGNLQFKDHATEMNVHSESIDTLTISGNTSTFTGTAKVDGVSGYSFSVDIEDNGEPGKDRDKFTIWIPGKSYSASGTLDGGNIQIHDYTQYPSSGNVPFPAVAVFVEVKTPPVADFEWAPEKPHTTEIVTFDASASYDPDGGEITKYEWDFGATGKIVTHVFGTEGNYTAILTVTDNKGVTNSTSKVVEVVSSPSENENQPPVAVAKARRNVTDERQRELTVPQYEPVMFDGSDSYDPDGYVINHIWDFGDRNESTLPGPVHVYWESGTYTVSLIVEDNDNLWFEHDDTLTIIVNPSEYNHSFADKVSFNVEDGGSDDSACIGEPVNIWVKTNGSSSVTYSVHADNRVIGTGGNPQGTKDFTWIPMSSGEHEIKVSAEVGGYPIEWIIDVVNVWIEQVK